MWSTVSLVQILPGYKSNDGKTMENTMLRNMPSKIMFYTDYVDIDQYSKSYIKYT